MQENRPNNLKNFFIKLISISFAVIIIINVIFNLLLGDRIEKIDEILSIFEMKERKKLKDEFMSELNKNLQKKNMIDKEDKIILFKVYKKIRKEFDELDLERN
jgi:hypothetical protein|tara:strand:- start:47 stop:355 length:309 start_codon:yes stop_codon:yes gene_type:complete